MWRRAIIIQAIWEDDLEQPENVLSLHRILAAGGSYFRYFERALAPRSVKRDDDENIYLTC